MLQVNPEAVVDIVLKGGVIAYPTEAVYGLGCDPDNEDAIHKLLAIKDRPWEKGLILVASDYSQLEDYVDCSELTPEQRQAVFDKWPGPYTFTMPLKVDTHHLLSGEHFSIAVRVSAHPDVRAICQALGKPIVSTSANFNGLKPAMTTDEVIQQFEGMVDALVIGNLGKESTPSTIIDPFSGDVLR